MGLAYAVEASANQKLGKFLMSTTFASECSCPSDCPLKEGACYAMTGPARVQWKRILPEGTPVEAANDEARAIDGLTGDRPLRLHTAGDCSSDEAALVVSRSAVRYASKRGSPVFTYTHAWKQVARESWLSVSILASCLSVAEVHAAKAKGYATSLVLPFLKFNTKKAFVYEGIKVVPCPKQTGNATSCYACRMCLRDQKLIKADITIGFAVHGPTRKAAKVFGKEKLPLYGGEKCTD